MDQWANLFTLIAAQLVLGLINGVFYALLSLGLALIFGMLNVINFAHGAVYMAGAFVAWMLLHYFGIPYWLSLVLSPIVIGIVGMIFERIALRRLYRLDHIYGWLLTYGLALMIESVFRNFYGVSGQPYSPPKILSGGVDLGFLYLPSYRLYAMLAALTVCATVWFTIEKTRLGSYLRAGTENPALTQTFGINVPLLVTLTYGLGTALAALAGVLAAPIYQVSSLMGSQVIATVFAVVVIGGVGSIIGTVITGLAIGVIEGITKLIYPPASHVITFVVMAIVLFVKPVGLFGRDK